MSITLGSLCSGIGGLELGVERGLGARTVWQAEIDPHASAVLAHRWPGVPNIGDFRGQELPPCDILTAGFPCQPVSTAGRRAGINDERWLFDDIAEAVGRMESPPRLLVFENVRGLLSANGGDAMGRVVHGLAAIGYLGQWRIVRASDVGCCHQRARLFVAAYPNGERARPEAGRGGRADASREERWRMRPGPFLGGDDAADADGEGLERPQPTSRRDLSAGGAPADATHVGRQRDGRARDRGAGPADSRFGLYAAAVRRQEAWHGPAPDPTTDGRLNPAFVEWMMGYPAGWVTDVLDSRNAALRCLGNAVVPQVAEAFCLGLLALCGQ